ncbi:hypothetical protein [Aeromicrobium sp. Root344]|uniref:hypothetical protein n=1 Tax=Aeromicrobium sp. Root344 TaxID=1736521 RepID=UPI001F1DB423|nr:hypothetical protein [Aeromicrobium sp. Root344]
MGTFAGLDQFDGKGFGYRLLAYPLLMVIVPAVWIWRRQKSLIPESRSLSLSKGRSPEDIPWGAFALIMAPFLVDVSGNTVDLYDSVDWWDNANHFFNWMLLLWGCGLLLRLVWTGPAWGLILTITGLGAILAVGWELGEWYTFIRRGTELDGAYEDTLSDELLGTLGALVAALIVGRKHKADQHVEDVASVV